MLDAKILSRFGLRVTRKNTFSFEKNGSPSFLIRPLVGDAEQAKCESLQRLTWGLPWRQVVPSNVFTALDHCHLPVLAAFTPSQEMVAILFGFMGLEPNSRKPFVHSHMLTVDPKLRRQGIGTAMKIAQARLCDDLGIDEIEWTVCPLRSNWAVNVRSLGGITNTYLPSLYNFTGAGIYQGYPADRVLLRWPFNSCYSRQRLEGSRPPISFAEAYCLPLIEDANDLTKLAVFGPDVDRVRIEVPDDIDAIWRTKAPRFFVSLVKPGSPLEPWLDRHYGQPLKRAERARTRPIFMKLFELGYTVTDFVHDSQTKKNYVIFTHNHILG